MKKYLPWIILFCSIIVSLSAAFYSVFGLAKLFSGAYYNVMIMAGSLEFSKLAVTAYLHEYWNRLGITLRLYLTLAVVILAIITSAGIYGFLSDAYQKTAMKDKYHTERTKLISTKKNRFELQLGELKNERTAVINNIQVLSKSISTDNQIQTIDKKTGQVLTQIRTSSKQGVQQQLDIESKRRDVLTSRIDALQDSIQTYEILKIESESKNDAASELGPLKYISGLTGVAMDVVVNWVLMLLIFVFDPLAITLVISALTAFKLNDTINIRKLEDNATQGEIQSPRGIVNDITEAAKPEEVNTEVNNPEVHEPIVTEKRRRGRPKGSKNKKESAPIKPSQDVLDISEKIEAEIQQSKNVADPTLTTEIVQQISKSFPVKKS